MPLIARSSENVVDPGPRNFAQRATIQSISEVNGAQGFIFNPRAFECLSSVVLPLNTTAPACESGCWDK